MERLEEEIISSNLKNIQIEEFIQENKCSSILKKVSSLADIPNSIIDDNILQEETVSVQSDLLKQKDERIKQLEKENMYLKHRIAKLEAQCKEHILSFQKIENHNTKIIKEARRHTKATNLVKSTYMDNINEFIKHFTKDPKTVMPYKNKLIRFCKIYLQEKEEVQLEEDRIYLVLSTNKSKGYANASKDIVSRFLIARYNYFLESRKHAFIHLPKTIKAAPCFEDLDAKKIWNEIKNKLDPSHQAIRLL